MTSNEFIFWFIGVLSMWVGVLAYRPMKNLWYVIKSSISHRKPKQPTMWYCDDLQSQVDELKEQINNLAERLATRDSNRKNNTRRVVREYLEELKNSK